MFNCVVWVLELFSEQQSVKFQWCSYSWKWHDLFESTAYKPLFHWTVYLQALFVCSHSSELSKETIQAISALFSIMAARETRQKDWNHLLLVLNQSGIYIVEFILIIKKSILKIQIVNLHFYSRNHSFLNTHCEIVYFILLFLLFFDLLLLCGQSCFILCARAFPVLMSWWCVWSSGCCHIGK